MRRIAGRHRGGIRALTQALHLQPGRVVHGGKYARGGHEHPCEQEDHQRDERHQVGGDDETHPGLELGHPRLGRAARDERPEDRLDAREDVRHAGQVGEDVVAVEAHQRQELLQGEHVLREGREQRRLLAGQRSRRPPHSSAKIPLK